MTLASVPTLVPVVLDVIVYFNPLFTAAHIFVFWLAHQRSDYPVS